MNPFEIKNPKCYARKAFLRLWFDEIYIKRSVYKKAKIHNPVALYTIGNTFFKKRNYERAFVWWRLATMAGSTDAQVGIGDLYKKGLGVDPDLEKAILWFNHAGKNGNHSAWAHIGECHMLVRDYEKAYYFYYKSAALGDAMGENNLGECYLNGHFVTRNDHNALSFFLRSAQKSYPKAKFNVAHMLEYGYGLNMDKEAALQWYKKSLDKGYRPARKAIRRLNRQGFKIKPKKKKTFFQKIKRIWKIIKK